MSGMMKRALWSWMTNLLSLIKKNDDGALGIKEKPKTSDHDEVVGKEKYIVVSDCNEDEALSKIEDLTTLNDGFVVSDYDDQTSGEGEEFTTSDDNFDHNDDKAGMD